jgi:hypothetical protein
LERRVRRWRYVGVHGRGEYVVLLCFGLLEELRWTLVLWESVNGEKDGCTGICKGKELCECGVERTI